MSYSRLLAVPVCALLLLTPTLAQWPDSAAENLLICNRNGEQAVPKIAPTSDGGCYVLWYDNGSGNYDVYLQRLDGDGVIQWQHNGLLVSDHAQQSWITDWDMTVDHQDHAIIAVNDIRAGGDWDIYGYRISPDGTFAWGPDGIAISNNDGFEPDPRVTVTTGGNIVFAWQEETAQGNVVNLRKLTPDGDDVYLPATLTMSSQYGLSIPRVIPAENDHVILQYLVHQGDQFWSPRHIYVQKFDSVGGAQWLEDGNPVMTTNGIGVQMKPDLVPDGSGGAYCFWYDTRNMDHHVFVQHVSSEGFALWTVNGVQASTATGQLQMSPSLAAHPATGDVTIFYQVTNLNQTQSGLGGQRLNSAGERQWTGGGINFCPLGDQQRFNIFALPEGTGSIVIYKEYVPGSAINATVRGFRVDPSGTETWETSPRDLCSVASEKGHLAACINHLGQAIATWPDSRFANHDMYLQNVNPDGSLGLLEPLEPTLAIIAPVDGDTVHTEDVIVEFEVENFVLNTEGGDGWMDVRLDGEHALYIDYTDPFTMTLHEGLNNIELELIGYDLQPLDPRVMDDVDVTYTVPSITIISPPQDTVYHTQNFVTVEFEVQQFDVAETGGDGWIHIVGWYSPGVPEPVIFLDMTYYLLDPIDIDFEGFGVHEIIFELVDNQGEPLAPRAADTLFVMFGDIGADDTPPGIPNRFTLHPAFPNPFNPATGIRFDVPTPADVRLVIYNTLGQQIATLNNGHLPAGRHELRWNGRDDHGISVAAGVYIVQLISSDFHASQKIMLVR